MAEDGFVGDGFLELANRLRALAASFKPLLEESSVVLDAAMRAKVDELYGPKLGKYWNLESKTGSDALATIKLWTDDAKVRGYEFGTARHRIPQAGYARPVLHFDWQGGQAFFAFVEHPGTKPHNKRFELEDAFKQQVRSVWSQSLSAALQNL